MSRFAPGRRASPACRSVGERGDLLGRQLVGEGRHLRGRGPGRDHRRGLGRPSGAPGSRAAAPGPCRQALLAVAGHAVLAGRAPAAGSVGGAMSAAMAKKGRAASAASGQMPMARRHDSVSTAASISRRRGSSPGRRPRRRRSPAGRVRVLPLQMSKWRQCAAAAHRPRLHLQAAHQRVGGVHPDRREGPLAHAAQVVVPPHGVGVHHARLSMLATFTPEELPPQATSRCADGACQRGKRSRTQCRQ